MPLILVKFPDEMSKKVNMSRFLSKYIKLDVSVVVDVNINDLAHVLEILKRNNCKVIVAEEVENQIIRSLIPIIKNIKSGSISPEKVGEFCNEVLEKYGSDNIEPEILEILNLCQKFSVDPHIDILNEIQIKLEAQLSKNILTSYSDYLTIDIDTYLMLFHVHNEEKEFKEFSKFNRYSNTFLKIFTRHGIVENMKVVSDWKEKVRVLFDRVSVKGEKLDPEDLDYVLIWKILHHLQNYMTKNALSIKLDIPPQKLDVLLRKLLDAQLIFIRKNEYKIRHLGEDFYNFINKQVEKRFKFQPTDFIPKECQNFISLITQIGLIDLAVILERAKKPIKHVSFHRVTINIEKYY
ncbi:MAG: hypothetical protein ACTSRP_04660 [Candidatus Helarchaeota archaeon]